MLDFVIRHADATWDNNGGADWHVRILAEAPSPSADVDTGPSNLCPGPAAVCVDVGAAPAADADDAGGCAVRGGRAPGGGLAALLLGVMVGVRRRRQ